MVPLGPIVATPMLSSAHYFYNDHFLTAQEGMVTLVHKSTNADQVAEKHYVEH